MTNGDKLNVRADLMEALCKALSGDDGIVVTRRDVTNVMNESWHALCNDTVVCMDVTLKLADGPAVFSIVGRFNFEKRCVVSATVVNDAGDAPFSIMGGVVGGLTYEEAVKRIDVFDPAEDGDLGDALHDVVDAIFDRSEGEPFSQRDFVRAAMFSMPTEFCEQVVNDMKESRRVGAGEASVVGEWMTNNSPDQDEGDEASVLFCKACFVKQPPSEIARLERSPGAGFRALTAAEMLEEMGCLSCDECGKEG